jgi:purine nucleosidase/pyrimidine-specific ribonucleoside hydrolase
VGIETTGTLTRGATVVDLHGRLGRTPNARVAVGLDVDRFFDLVIAAVARLT